MSNCCWKQPLTKVQYISYRENQDDKWYIGRAIRNNGIYNLCCGPLGGPYTSETLAEQEADKMNITLQEETDKLMDNILFHVRQLETLTKELMG